MWGRGFVYIVYIMEELEDCKLWEFHVLKIMVLSGGVGTCTRMMYL